MTKIHPLENALHSLHSLFLSDTFVPSKSQYKNPCVIDPVFEDTSLFKFALDKGGDSTKGIQSPVNVKNPQSQDHVLPILEFGGGVKDTDHNVRKAGFTQGGCVRDGIEAIMQR